ncbi:hypothetical protein P7K49_010655 [Saguinus oedipus]|uniref:Uncharacterized protein n=1 Tax=Saguinus oedipus TaxID=9490 RepID=A0ABQ9VNE3_SAGOE|nr:hypothetical protein P7K49_010655 [Saguinus oedipus]
MAALLKPETGATASCPEQGLGSNVEPEVPAWVSRRPQRQSASGRLWWVWLVPTAPRVELPPP